MKFSQRPLFSLATALCGIGLISCGGDEDPKGGGAGAGGDGGGDELLSRVDVTDSDVFPIDAGKYTVLEILTDGMKEERAQQQAEDTITKHPDIACMVGLWEYNAPMILNAVEGAGKVGEIKIVSFDENSATLDGIAKGSIQGTVAQQPFLFGYRSAELLSAMVRGKEVNPDGDPIIVPVTVVKKDTVANFRATIEAIRAGKGTPPEDMLDEYPASDEQVSVAFVTNGVNPFWELAHEGFKLAAAKHNVDTKFVVPDQASVEQQNRMVEEQLVSGTDAFAISPIAAAGQTAFLSEVGSKVPLICQDSDAPESNRRFYLGTSNYLAGREAGKLIKEAVPDGGKVMIFVGKMEVKNAQERSQGVVDELMGLPIPE